MVKVCDSPLHRDARAEEVVIFGVNSIVCAEGSWGSVYCQLQAKVLLRLQSWLLRITEHTANQIQFSQCALEKQMLQRTVHLFLI